MNPYKIGSGVTAWLLVSLVVFVNLVAHYPKKSAWDIILTSFMGGAFVLALVSGFVLLGSLAFGLWDKGEDYRFQRQHERRKHHSDEPEVDYDD
jgi:hypothetical protein